MKRFKLCLYFGADSDEEAQEFVRTLTEASRIISSRSLCISLENLDRYRMFKQCLGWGSVIGVLAVSIALYFVAEGWWTR